jgi:hypothetical protein
MDTILKRREMRKQLDGAIGVSVETIQQKRNSHFLSAGTGHK